MKQPVGAERAVLAAVALGTVLAPLNSTMIAVALPRIKDDFHTSLSSVAWLVTSYLIALAALQPVTGKIGDRVGRRPMVLGGLGAFGLASLGAAVAPTLAVLVVFRLLQAVAGAVLLPNGFALVREVAAPGRRAWAFGLIGAAAGLAASIGPTFGGLVIGAAGWRAAFYANVPIVLAALALFVRAVPRRQTERPTVPFDVTGSVLLCVVLGGAAGLVLEGRGSASSWLVAASGVALLIAFAYLIRHELRHPDPVIHPRLFLIRPFAAATGGVAFNNLSFYTTLLAAPLLLSDRFGWTSVETGLGLTALTVPSFLFSAVGGRLADRAGRRLPAVLGNAIAAVGLVPLLFGAADRPASLLACLAVAGIGFGLSVATMQTSAVEAVEAEQAGVASGLYSTSRYIGSIIGSVALGALLTTRRGSVSGFREVAVLVIVAAVAATLVSFGLTPGARRRALAVPPAVPESELR